MKLSSPNLQQVINNTDALTAKDVNKKALHAEGTPGFQERLISGFENVAKAQSDAAELAKNFEIGTENDLAKVMVGQQVSSIAFQLTLNVRNKALSAYKDIMNMPV